MHRLFLVSLLVIIISISLFAITKSSNKINGSVPQVKKEEIDESSLQKTYINEQYGFKISYPDEVILYRNGPNFFQQKIDAFEEISGTIPPYYESIDFKKEAVTLFSLTIFHKGNGVINTYDGSCGSQFAEKNLTESYGTTSWGKYLTIKQLANSSENITYICFLSGSDNLITIKQIESLSNQNLSIIPLKEIIDSVELITPKKIASSLTPIALTKEYLNIYKTCVQKEKPGVPACNFNIPEYTDTRLDHNLASWNNDFNPILCSNTVVDKISPFHQVIRESMAEVLVESFSGKTKINSRVVLEHANGHWLIVNIICQ